MIKIDWLQLLKIGELKLTCMGYNTNHPHRIRGECFCEDLQISVVSTQARPVYGMINSVYVRIDTHESRCAMSFSEYGPRLFLLPKNSGREYWHGWQASSTTNLVIDSHIQHKKQNNLSQSQAVTLAYYLRSNCSFRINSRMYWISLISLLDSTQCLSTQLSQYMFRV